MSDKPKYTSDEQTNEQLVSKSITSSKDCPQTGEEIDEVNME